MNGSTTNSRSRTRTITEVLTMAAAVTLGVTGICNASFGDDQVKSSAAMIDVGFITAALAVLNLIRHGEERNSVRYQDSDGSERTLYEAGILSGLLIGVALNAYQLQGVVAENKQKDWHSGLNAAMLAILGIAVLGRVALCAGMQLPASSANNEAAPFLRELRTSAQTPRIRPLDDGMMHSGQEEPSSGLR